VRHPSPVGFLAAGVLQQALRGLWRRCRVGNRLETHRRTLGTVRNTTGPRPAKQLQPQAWHDTERSSSPRHDGVWAGDGGSNIALPLDAIHLDERTVPADTPRWALHSKPARLGGQVREVVGIGALAMAVGRSPVTIRRWIRLGVIPRERYRRRGVDIRGERRLFPVEHVAVIAEIAEEELYSVRVDPSGQFSHRVREALARATD